MPIPEPALKTALRQRVKTTTSSYKPLLIRFSPQLSNLNDPMAEWLWMLSCCVAAGLANGKRKSADMYCITRVVIVKFEQASPQTMFSPRNPLPSACRPPRGLLTGIPSGCTRYDTAHGVASAAAKRHLTQKHQKSVSTCNQQLKLCRASSGEKQNGTKTRHSWSVHFARLLKLQQRFNSATFGEHEQADMLSMDSCGKRC